MERFVGVIRVGGMRRFAGGPFEDEFLSSGGAAFSYLDVRGG